jgi:hypothetical protein
MGERVQVLKISCVLIKKKKKKSFHLELVYTMNFWYFYCLSVLETGDEVSSGEMSENLDCAAEPYKII